MMLRLEARLPVLFFCPPVWGQHPRLRPRRPPQTSTQRARLSKNRNRNVRQRFRCEDISSAACANSGSKGARSAL
eukprot:2835373-Pyramimonas_sp.AAC.1